MSDQNFFVPDSDELCDGTALYCDDGEFLNLLSTHFLICNDKIKDKGEDSGYEAYCDTAGIMGAFDGCGGLGAKSCEAISGKTQAYVTSRAVGSAVRTWFSENADVEYPWDVDDLKSKILAVLRKCKEYSGEEESRLRGSMVRSFPSTIAAITFQIVNGMLTTDHVWAGDSRTYVLDQGGLGQISVDDIRGEDAMSNLSKDGALTNVISVDRDFTLHVANFTPAGPCIMACASDGCFGYVRSPMEFELMILSTLENARNVEEWKKTLDHEISGRAGDDQTIAIAAFGFESFQEMKEFYYDRYLYVHDVVSQFDRADAEGKQALWESYKPDYYRYSAREA